jgi:hypothetical protein
VTNAHPRLLAAIAISTIALSLVGCAQAKPEALPTPTATPTPSATPTADLFALPVSAFDVTCDELVPLAKMVELYGPGTVRMNVSYAGVADWSLGTTAALTDGALICHWGPADSSFPSATIEATLATPDQFALARQVFDDVPRPSPPVPILDVARARCGDNYPSDTSRAYCDWSVYSGDVWMVARFTELPSSEVQEPATRVNPDTSANSPTARPDSLSARILVDAAQLLNTSERPEREASPTQLTTCDAALERLRMGLAGDIELGEATDRTAFDGQGIGSLSIERRGWTRCSVSIPSQPFGGVVLTIAQDAAWVLADDGPVVARMQRLSNGDGVIRCAADEGGAQCDAAIVVGANVAAITVFDTDQALAEALVVAAARVLN